MSAETLLAHLQGSYHMLDAHELLDTLISDVFKNKIALISSFGADASLMLSLVAEVDKTTPVLFLETHKHFPETLAYGKQLTDELGLSNVHYLTPNPELINNVDASGDLWSVNANRCCWLRKVEPLERAVKDLGIEALITGRKRYQTKDREKMHNIELDEHKIFRINPIADWSRERQKEEIAARNLPLHPLVAQGYPSIGCAPCTSKVLPGQDERAGRWAHTAKAGIEQKTECGLHVSLEQGH